MAVDQVSVKLRGRAESPRFCVELDDRFSRCKEKMDDLVRNVGSPPRENGFPVFKEGANSFLCIIHFKGAGLVECIDL